MNRPPVLYDKAMHEARKYWRERLEAMSFDRHVALDHPRPRDGDPVRSIVEQELDPDTHALLRRVTSGNPFLAYAALLLALKLGCCRYSGRSEVTVLCPGPDGAAPNLLPIRSVLDLRRSFKDALLAMREALASAYAAHQYPWSRMWLDLREPRRPRQVPLIATMAGLHGELAEQPCDLLVRFESSGSRTWTACQFDARMYEAATLQRFVAAVHAILRRGLCEMSVRIGDLARDHEPGPASPVPPDDAREELDGAQVVDLDKVRLDWMIEARSAQQPERVAIVEHGCVTTYATLERRATQLAEALALLGLDVRRPIALLMDAGTELIASMLGVLKLGAAFAPIKLLSTRRELGEVLAALDAECVLCQPGHLADLSQVRAALPDLRHVIAIPPERSPADEVGERGAAAGGVAEPPVVDGGGLSTACVLVAEIEDGVSTIAVTHRELVQTFAWLQERCGIVAQDRCLLSPALTPCAQLFDTLGMLMAGASVEIVDPSRLRSPAQLADALMARDITLWDLPTGLAQNLLTSVRALCARPDRAPGPRNVLLGGEAQCAQLARRLRQCFPSAQVTGLYAHPALGMWSTVFPLGEPATGDSVLAAAVPGFAHGVKHPSGEPAAPCTRGELELVRMVAAPMAHRVRTGLRASPRDGGGIVWLRGRDHCFVKYECGVELTRLEAMLCEHPHILAAEVVTVAPERAAESLVVAFLLAEPEQVSAEAARDFLVRRAGVDLIPDRFLVLDELPLTPDGAIDRAELVRRCVRSPPASDDARDLDGEQVHRQLKRIWLDVLQVDEVDDQDSFFARGGNSLKATLLIARIKEDFAVDLSVQKFFRAPTTRAVAQLIADEARRSVGQPREPDFKIVPRERYRVQLPDLDG